MTRQIILGASAMLVAFAALLAASAALVFATLRIEQIARAAAHAAAAGAELIFGALALLAAVFIAMRVAVAAFTRRSSSQNNAVEQTPASGTIS